MASEPCPAQVVCKLTRSWMAVRYYERILGSVDRQPYNNNLVVPLVTLLPVCLSVCLSASSTLSEQISQRDHGQVEVLIIIKETHPGIFFPLLLPLWT